MDEALYQHLLCPPIYQVNPSDDDYMIEWEEWTAKEDGFGPRAVWDPMDIYDSTTGKGHGQYGR